MILSVTDINLSFVENEILKNISFLINEGEKVALIGDNGSGKSTLLKVIVGEYTPDSGSVIFKKDSKFGYVAQNQNFSSTLTVYEEILQSKKSLIEAENALRRMEENMVNVPENEMDNYMNKYHSATEAFDKNGGYTYKSEINAILKGLMFTEDTYNKSSSLLSGGERTRLMLGKILLEKPELIILDEPTNYLDIKSVEWLENYLSSISSAVLLVSHDRYFINKVATRVMEITNGHLLDFQGNYDEFQVKKEQIIEAQIAAYENQQREIAHQMEVIRKLRSFNREKSIKRAESRVKMLDKIERIEKPVEEDNEMQLFLSPDIESGNDVLYCENLSKSYEGRNLFKDVKLDIKKGEHVAIIGPNGSGKTTILKIINDIIESDTNPIIKFGSNVTIGYFDQQSTVIDDKKTLFDEISDSYPNMTQTEIRNVLGAFLFSNDDVFKKIGVLSGGEKCRVVLAKIMLSKANFLILDEPTNHLDMTSKAILEEAIKGYEGTCLYVSHDRYFINQTATRILSLNNNNFTNYIGNYDYYLEKCEILEAKDKEDTSPKEVKAETEAKLDWKEQKQANAEKRKLEAKINRIEAEIEKLENKLAELEQEMSNPNVSSNSAKLNEICSKQAEINEKLNSLYEEWESLNE
ncbi:MAG: ABC-F family ATP-binding cassette domain-containing protein [Lachnospiraceae bacterium]|nr:ABC-F family ATP-binding cassette domain-containing protein [Lachnospiraceae bacterium]